MAFNQPQRSIATEITQFLSLNNLQSKDIDVLMLGYNADASQQAYFEAMAACFPETAIAYYQHISGSMIRPLLMGQPPLHKYLKRSNSRRIFPTIALNQTG